MSELCVRSDDVIDSGVKLKDYLDSAIESVSNDYISVSNAESIPKNETMDLIQKYRNVLLCLREICKNRKKF